MAGDQGTSAICAGISGAQVRARLVGTPALSKEKETFVENRNLSKCRSDCYFDQWRDAIFACNRKKTGTSNVRKLIL